MLEQLKLWDESLTLQMNGSHSLYWDGVMLTVTSTWIWIPVGIILLYVLIKNNDWGHFLFTILALGLCLLLADQVASGICKPFFHRFRPSNDPLLMYSIDVVDGYRGGRYGFFSSHAANTFAIATFLIHLFRDKVTSGFLFLWAVLNGYSRIYLGVHYLGDVLIGTLWGIFVGWTLFLCYRKLASSCLAAPRHYISSEYTRSGYRLNDLRLLLVVFLFTYLYIVIAGNCLML